MVVVVVVPPLLFLPHRLLLRAAAAQHPYSGYDPPAIGRRRRPELDVIDGCTPRTTTMTAKKKKSKNGREWTRPFGCSILCSP